MTDDPRTDDVKWTDALKPDWCTEDHDESNDFLCYPGDGECPCETWKHHVHCGHGLIIQIG